ncbi:acyl-CoA synthetase [Saccharomonospora piscinae]|uniref:AMP-binding protein n=1 Tax=Saccharomonospora piscinae TaxID=687388 RepID=UPI001106E92E|nr:AMP-binding protein [Saccharomonospora piscinae]TLW95141.1 acyl-CoA synthetase [Saccharomonospora piscinae]
MNLLSLLAGQTKHDPHAIIAIDADPDQPQHVSRAELWRRTLQLRADLATAGVGRGDGVLVALPAWSSVLEWHIASASLGARVVPAGSGAAAAGLADLLLRVRPKVVALPHLAPLGRDDARPALRDAVSLAQGAPPPTVAVVTAPGGRPPVDPSPYDVGAGAWLPSAATAGMPMPDVRGDDELAVAFPPSLAAHRESALTRHAEAVAAALGLGDDVLLCATGPDHPAWLGLALAAVAGGGTCLLEPAPSPHAVLDDVTRFGVSHLALPERLVPPLTGPGRTPATTVRWLGVLGDTLPEGTARQAEQALGAVLTTVYTAPGLLCPAALWPTGAPLADRVRPGGEPLGHGAEVRIVDPATGIPREHGESGEIQLRGSMAACSVLDAPGDPVPGRTSDGWFGTGDAGTLDSGGVLRRTGRVTATTRD